MTTARELLARLQGERASRLRLVEEAKQELESYESNAGTLAASGTPVDKITAQIRELRDVAEVHAAAVVVLDKSIGAAKEGIIAERRTELQALAETARAELKEHAAKVGDVVEALYEVEETRALRIESGGDPLAKSVLLAQAATHFGKQASRLAAGLPELPFDSMIY